MFQLHWVETETGELMKLRLTRAKFLEHFANRAPCLVGMEACGGAQHWARQLLALGHEVRLLPAKMVRPFGRGNKNDSRDAEAIWTAVQQPGTKTVAVKTEEQQGIENFAGCRGLLFLSRAHAGSLQTSCPAPARHPIELRTR